MKKLSNLLLWLLVVDLGIALGAGLYESRIVVPHWAGLPPEQWPNTGLQFWVYVTTVPLTLLALGSSVVAGRTPRPQRTWWLRALAFVVVERLTTFGYFIPTMLTMMGGELPPAELQATLSTWRLLNNGRHVLTALAFLCALKALSVAARRTAEPT